MTSPTVATVQAYYDERVEGKLRDFTSANPRIEAAVETIARWAPARPKRILEIGCGIGATSWRMARAWPDAEVMGADISPASIDVAQACFRLPNLLFRAGPVERGVPGGSFDLVVLMDVYEHIAIAERGSLHGALASLLPEDARVILTAPTPALQRHDRVRCPSAMQPVDEDVTVADLLRLAEDTRSRLLYFREIDVWECGDYFHAVLGRAPELGSVEPVRGLRPWLGRVFPRSARNVVRRFNVSRSQRQQLASLWVRPGATARRMS